MILEHTQETKEAVINDSSMPPAHFHIHILRDGKVVGTDIYEKKTDGTYAKTGAQIPLKKSRALEELREALSDGATIPEVFKSREVYAFILNLYIEKDTLLSKEKTPVNIDNCLLFSDKQFFRDLTNYFASNEAKQGENTLTDDEKVRLNKMFNKLIEPGSFVLPGRLQEIMEVTNLSEKEVRKIAGFTAR